MRYSFDFESEELKNLSSEKKNSKYYEWADALWMSGLQYPIYRLKEELNVSSNWINTVLMPEIDTVKYQLKYLSHKFQENENDSRYRGSVYCRKKDVIEWIKNTATFERQTIVRDFLEVQQITEEEYITLMMEEHQKTKLNTTHHHVKNSPRILGEAGMLPGNTKRSIFPWVPIEPVDIFDYRIIPANSYRDEFKNPERLYRYAFYNGAIKVSLGDRKTLFLIEKKLPRYGWVRVFQNEDWTGEES